MKILAAFLLLVLMLLSGAWLAINNYSDQLQTARGEAYLADCRARVPVPVTLNGEPFDLSACG